MKIWFTFVAGFMTIFLTINAFSQTTIPGGFVNGTWTASGSPYLIEGPVQVANGQTLTIEPGVMVSFQGFYKLLVMGRIIALGTQTDSIYFTAVDEVAGWRGIRFDNTPSTNDTSRLMYCVVKFGNTNGAPSDINGGAILFNNFSKAVVSHCLLSNNKTDSYLGGSGGAIYCYDSSPVISYNRISGNASSTTGYGSGGGIYSGGMGKPLIAYNIITGNSAGYGGGIYCVHATIIHNTISQNTVAYNGAGIFCGGYGNATIRKNLIEENVAYDGWQGGGGIFVEGSMAVIEDNTIINNISTGIGGGGIYSQGNTFIRRNIISNNTANQSLNGFGGGIYIELSGGINKQEISNNILTNNYAHNGGGIYCKSSNSEMDNNLIANNDAVNGGGVYFCYESNPILRNCIIRGNTSINGASQIFLFDEPSDPAFVYCNIENGLSGFNTNGNFYSGNYSHNLETDPQFASPSEGSGTNYSGYNADWSLPEGSTCIEAGDPLSICNITDINGFPRVSGCKIDIGPYEMQVNGSLLLEIACINESDYWACDGSAEAIINGGSPPFSYEWSNGATSQSLSGLCGGTYNVTVTDGSGCVRYGEVTIYNMLGMTDQAENKKSFRLFPNPANDFITVSIENNTTEGSILTIYDILGAKVLSEKLTDNQPIISIGDLENGLHIVTLQSNGLIEQQKLIIKK